MYSWHKGSNTPSIRNLVVGEEGMRPGQATGWGQYFAFLQSFDVVGWMTRKDIWPAKNLCHLSQKVLFQNKWKES